MAGASDLVLTQRDTHGLWVAVGDKDSIFDTPARRL